jgi:hypothetical protein
MNCRPNCIRSQLRNDRGAASKVDSACSLGTTASATFRTLRMTADDGCLSPVCPQEKRWESGARQSEGSIVMGMRGRGPWRQFRICAALDLGRPRTQP